MALFLTIHSFLLKLVKLAFKFKLIVEAKNERSIERVNISVCASEYSDFAIEICNVQYTKESSSIASY